MGRDPYRRYRRRMRRYGRNRDAAYPMLIIDPYEPFAFLMLAAVSRWAYRHRSAFAPFIIALSAFITAAMLHTHHAQLWIPIATVTAIIAVVLGFPHSMLRRLPTGAHVARSLYRLWAACGIDRAIERAYASTVIAVTGAWLAAAIAVGPTVKPLPQIDGVGTVLLGIPWWAHRRRREKVRVERIIEGWPEVAENIGLPGAHIASVVVDAWGWTARVILKKGATTSQAIGKIPDIESGLSLRPGSVRVTADQRRADRFTMRVIEKDPQAEPVSWTGSTVTSVTQPIAIGVSEDGQPVRVLVLRRNVLIGGIMGSGKSGVLNVLIAALVGCRDVVLWGVDLKGGMELQPWADCLGRLATTPEEACALFRDAVGWLNRRAREKATQGKRVLDPTPDDPALIIVVDEYAELPDEAHDCADSIARRGRAVAVNLIAATQRPTQVAMGKNTAVRSQMDVRICLRVRERRDVDLILGQGAFNSGWHAHQLVQPGAFLISDPEHATPERHQAYLLTDEQIARQSVQHADTCPELPPGGPDTPPTAPRSPQSLEPGTSRVADQANPNVTLWAVLSNAGSDGVPVAELKQATGMSRATLYRRLQALANAGRVVQTIRGYWRAAEPSAAPEGDKQ
jgi:DNA segregation ATPase FtsK/SpoIIIE, S-DNA-T family